jgi:hypothetical protein
LRQALWNKIDKGKVLAPTRECQDAIVEESEDDNFDPCVYSLYIVK